MWLGCSTFCGWSSIKRWEQHHEDACDPTFLCRVHILHWICCAVCSLKIRNEWQFSIGGGDKILYRCSTIPWLIFETMPSPPILLSPDFVRVATRTGSWSWKGCSFFMFLTFNRMKTGSSSSQYFAHSTSLLIVTSFAALLSMLRPSASEAVSGVRVRVEIKVRGLRLRLECLGLG